MHVDIDTGDVLDQIAYIPKRTDFFKAFFKEVLSKMC